MKKPKFVPKPPEAPEVIEARWQKKKQRLQHISNGIRRLRVNLTKDLKSDNEKQRLTALVVSVMDETAERVGNDQSASNGHYGVTGLKKKHVSVIGNHAILTYTGKSGVDHQKEFSDSKIAPVLKAAIKDSPSEWVFETSDGFRIKADRVNRYLSEFGISAKDIRGYAANRLVVQKLNKLDIPESDKKRKTQLNKVIKQVADKIGHGKGTLKKHYLIPELPIEYIENGKIINTKDLGYVMEDGGQITGSNKISSRFKEHYAEYGGLILGGY